MSLINQMLQDIEKRQGEGATESKLPEWVPAAVSERRSSARYLLPALVFLSLAIIVTGFYFWQRPSSEPSVPALAVVVDAPASVPAVPAESTVPESSSISAPIPTATAPENPSTPDRLMLTDEKPRTASAKAAKAKPGAAARKPGEVRPATDRTASVAKSSPQNEAHELAEQLYRNALAAYAQGRTSESLNQSQQALMAEPAHLNARQLLIRQLIEQRDKDQARAVVRDGLQLHPAQVQWATLLARLELDKGDIVAARRVVDQSAPQASGSADFQSMAGAIAQRQGKPEEAAEFYRNALRLKPAEGRNWVGLGLALEADGHAPEAREAFRRALATDGLSPDLQALAQRKSR